MPLATFQGQPSKNAYKKCNFFYFRTVQKIILPKSSSNNLNFELESKLLIIPTKDVDEFDIMEREEEISVMVSLHISV